MRSREWIEAKAEINGRREAMFFKRKSHSPEKFIGDRGIDLEYALFTADRHKPAGAEVDQSKLQGGLGWAAGVEKNGWAIDHFKERLKNLPLLA